MTRRVGMVGRLLPTAIAMGAGGAWAADWSQTLEAAANGFYMTNPQLQPGSAVADRAAQLAVDGATSAQTELWQLAVTPRFSITRYQRQTGLDINTGSLDFSYLRKLERGQWSLSGQALSDSTVTSELGLTGITNVNRRHDAGFASAGCQYFSSERLSWLLQGTFQLTRYSDAQRFALTNYNYGSLLLAPTWTFSERLQGALLLETDRVDPLSGGTAQKDYSASLKLSRALRDGYAWRASIGATRVQSGTARASTDSVLELGASRQGERFQWDLSVKRAVLPIGLGLLAREDQATASLAVSTSERSTLSLAVSAIRTDPVSVAVYLDPLISFSYLVYSGASWEQASAEWKYRLSRSWALSAAYVQARAHDGNWQQWANGNQARLGVVWQSGRL